MFQNWYIYSQHLKKDILAKWWYRCTRIKTCMKIKPKIYTANPSLPNYQINASQFGQNWKRALVASKPSFIHNPGSSFQERSIRNLESLIRGPKCRRMLPKTPEWVRKSEVLHPIEALALVCKVSMAAQLPRKGAHSHQRQDGRLDLEELTPAHLARPRLKQRLLLY